MISEDNERVSFADFIALSEQFLQALRRVVVEAREKFDVSARAGG